MKNLANCKPSEFLRQTVKIKKSVEKWLKLTDIMNIRKNVPTLPKDMSIVEKNKRLAEIGRENVSKMFDAIAEKHPDETMELLALCCFVEPENVDDHEIAEYLDSFAELIANESVRNFFTSLVNLGLINISDTQKA